jgi:hypothetical protein
MPQQDGCVILNHVKEALSRYQAYGKTLLALPDVRQLVNRYNAAIDNTQAVMRHAGVTVVCGLCASQTGSCCFQEVETWYDPTLLLMNLLLEADLPRSREIPGECLFLGEKGCRLRARYAFCLNYFCPALKARLGPASMETILAAVGEELAVGWELEQTLYRWARDAGETGS